jgi:hypothetical protein
LTVPLIASVFPEELTALRVFGLALGVLLIALAVWRRRSLSNGAVLLSIFGGFALLLISGTELLDKLLSAFAFEKGNGGRILGLAVFSIVILFLLVLRALTESARMNQQLSALLEGLAWEEFRQAKLPERFRDKVAVVIPAYNEADNIAHVIGALPATVCGYELHAIVVDDGSADDTTDRARAAGAAGVRLPLNRGQGAALRTGYRLALATGAEIVVTMDADGQHQPSELSRLVGPIAEGDVDVVGGSRVLGDADPSHAAREMGIKLFARLLSLLTWSKVTDPACGYRAVRTSSLRGLEFRQDQFHNSEFIVEASKKHLRTIEAPVTVTNRLSGQSKKPPHFRYGMGFANALMRAWLR